jgi:glycosyltransferase involved in cell wall biosynthesis
MQITKSKKVPTVWMNVTTSANWTRPPVGIVRVEQALCEELGKLLGITRFKQCVWVDGEFSEWIPTSTEEDERHAKAVDIIFPNSKSFDLSRKFLARALGTFERKSINKSSASSNLLEISVPLDTLINTRPVYGDIIISVGLDWDQPYTSAFFDLSNKHGLKIITCCYDLIPVLFPQYCVGDVASRFKEYFNMLTWGSAAVLCISKQTQNDYLALCSQLGAPERPTCILPLGDNVPSGNGDISPAIEAVLAEPFILFVSTIERRKNHEVLYRAYHLLCQLGHKHLLPKLVFVGMPGWGVGDLLKDIELDPLTQGLIIQLNHVNDGELGELYKKALFCVYPSLYEGWGLPVGEALAVGKAVLASNQGSLPEVGGNLVKYLDPWNSKSWADAILEWVTSPSAIQQMERKVVEQYEVRSWAAAAKSVEQLIDS